MRKFFVLVKKELREILTLQMVLPFLAVMLVFMFVGKVVGKESAKTATAPQPIVVLNLDQSETAQFVIEELRKQKFEIYFPEEQARDEALALAREKDAKAVLVIPAGMEQGLIARQPQTLEVYALLKQISYFGMKTSQNLAVAIATINAELGTKIFQDLQKDLDPTIVKQPLLTKDFVAVKENVANIPPGTIVSFLSSQTLFIPIVLFLVIVFASQLIAVAIATEKENKTLETLLSAPVQREAIIGAKLISAGAVSLLFAGVYLLGIRSYMTGVTGGASTGVADAAAKTAAQELGLVFSNPDYLLLGLSLFSGILAALAVAIILGSLAEDSKSAPGLVAPLMVLVLIPYFLTMFLDISSASPIVRILVYAIPFAHPFLAATNILLGNYREVVWGIVYMLVVFGIFVIIAARIFATDKILTMRLRFKKRT